VVLIHPYFYVERHKSSNFLNKPYMKNWIDGQIVMQTLKISPRTLQRLRDNGKLPYSKIGRKIFYKPSDIDRILDDNYVMFGIRNGLRL